MINFLKSIFSKSEPEGTPYTNQYSFQTYDSVFSNKPSRSEVIKSALEKHGLKEKSTPAFGKVKARYVYAPAFTVYGALLGNISSVQAGVDKVAKTVSGCRWYVKDSNGYTNYDLTEQIWVHEGLNELVYKAVHQLLVYGNVFYTQNDYNGKIILPPASELDLFIADNSTYELTSFWWQSEEFDRVEYRNTEKEKQFYLSRMPDIDSMVFGASKLRAPTTEIDFLAIDNESIQAYLRNGNFNQIMVLLPENEEGIKQEIESVMRSNLDRRIRNTPSVVPGGLTSEGLPKFKIQAIKQDPQTRLELGERKEVDGKVYDALGIPRALMGITDGSKLLSANEFEPAMILFANETVNPLARKILSDCKHFVLPKILKRLEKNGYFKDKQFTIKDPKTDEERVVTAEDFSLDVEGLDVETPSEKRKSYIEGFRSTLFTAREVKARAYGYSELDLEDDDGFRIIQGKTTIVKEGELREGSTEDGTAQDGINEDIADEETEAVDVKDPNAEIEETTKSFAERNKKETKKLLRSFGGYETSQVEKAVDSKKGRQLKALIRKKLEEQYSVADELLNQIPDEPRE